MAKQITSSEITTCAKDENALSLASSSTHVPQAPPSLEINAPKIPFRFSFTREEIHCPGETTANKSTISVKKSTRNPLFQFYRPKSTRMEGDLIRIKMHHGGSFSKEGELCYVGGQVSIFRNCDSERLPYFCLVDMAKDVGFNAGDELFYAIPGYNLENGIDKLHDDHSVHKMLNYTKKSKSAELYIKHLEQGVSATPRFGQDVADNHGEESREGAGPLFMKPMLHFDKLCEIYASDLAKGGNAKGPGDQQRVEGFVAVDDDDDPVNHVVDKANAQKHGTENPTAPKGRLLAPRLFFPSNPARSGFGVAKLAVRGVHVVLVQVDELSCVDGFMWLLVAPTVKAEAKGMMQLMLAAGRTDIPKEVRKVGNMKR
uniref:PB1-like domain-containing protein n=1 Tax=Oryza nivara TaxID=4536 RepID=A0A0E0GX48_ORYNI